MVRKLPFTALSAAILILASGANPAWAEMDGAANEESPLVAERYSPHLGPRRPDPRVDQRNPGRPGEQRIQSERGDVRGQVRRDDPRSYQGRVDPRDTDRRGDRRDLDRRGDPGVYQGRDFDHGAYYQPGRSDNRGAYYQPGRSDNRGAYYQPGRGDRRGAGPDHQFHRGDRLPYYYRSSRYVVDDWRGHRLSAPPPGQHWVQTGGDYVLIAIATGLILQILLAN